MQVLLPRTRQAVEPGAPRRANSSESGQALVIFVGALTVLLVMVGLVIDGGVAFFNRRDAQNTADLAALAGTKTIAEHYTKGGRSGSDVYAAILGNVRGNACAPDAQTVCTWSATYVKPGSDTEIELGPVTSAGAIPAGAQGVHVSVARRPRTWFLSVIGQQTWDVDGRATGLTARLNQLPPGQVLPIAVDPPNNNFIAGASYNLTAGKDAPGNFSWLSWDGKNDAGSLAHSLCHPNNPALEFPVWLTGDPGKTNATSVRECLDDWIGNQRTVLIPLWDSIRGQGNSVEYHITGLAAFTIGDHTQPAIDQITARFVEYYPLPTVPGRYGGPPCAPGSPGCGDQAIFVGIVR